MLGGKCTAEGMSNLLTKFGAIILSHTYFYSANQAMNTYKSEIELKIKWCGCNCMSASLSTCHQYVYVWVRIGHVSICLVEISPPVFETAIMSPHPCKWHCTPQSRRHTHTRPRWTKNASVRLQVQWIYWIYCLWNFFFRVFCGQNQLCILWTNPSGSFCKSGASSFRPSRCLKFLQVFLALERICANATSPNNRSRSLKPVSVGVARLDTWKTIGVERCDVLLLLEGRWHVPFSVWFALLLGSNN